MEDDLGGSRKLAIGLWTLGALALAALLLLFRPFDAQAVQSAVSIAPGNYVGVATCGGSTCHGRSEGDGPRRPPGRADALAGSGERRRRAQPRLCRASRAARPARSRSGSASARRPARRCASAATRPRPARAASASRPPTASAANPATAPASGWLASHYAVGGTHAANVARRHGPARRSRGRAPSVCLDCHFGSGERRPVRHPPDHGRRPSADHLRARPVLHAAAASHDRRRLSPARRAGDRRRRSGRSARRWRWSARSRSVRRRSAAPRASSPNSISSTATAATGGSRTIPTLPPERGRQSGPADPVGHAALQRREHDHALGRGAGGRARAGRRGSTRDSRAFHQAMARWPAGGGRRREPAARRRARRSPAPSRPRDMGRAPTFAIIDAIASEAIRARFTDYAGSVQAVMAVDTLLSALVSGGACRRAPPPMRSAPTSTAPIAPCAIPTPIDPGDFRASLGRAAAAIRTLEMSSMKRTAVAAIAIAAVLLASCGGGGGGGGPDPGAGTRRRSRRRRRGCSPIPAPVALTVADVQQIIAQAVAEAQARSPPADDRRRRPGRQRARRLPDERRQCGLAVPRRAERHQSRSAGRQRPGRRRRRRDRQGDHRRLSLLRRQRLLDPHRQHDRAGAFPALGRRRAGWRAGRCSACSSASCPAPISSTRFGAPGAAALIGPKRSPLGLAADPGGFPLYKNGVVVGGVGVMADGVYGFDPEIQDVDRDDEEVIALAATQRLRRAAPRSAPTGSASTAPRCASPTPTVADLRATRRRAGLRRRSPARRAPWSRCAATTPAPAIIAGTAYGTEASGVRARHRRRIRQPRRLRPHQRRRREPLSGRGGRRPTAGTAADRGRSPRDARGSLHGHGRARAPDPPAARQPRAGHASRSSTPAARSSASSARPTRRSSASTSRCRRRAPPPSSRSADAAGADLLADPERATSAASSRRRATFLGDPDRADRPDRLRRPRAIGNLVAALFPGRRGRPPARPALAPDRPVQPLLDRAAVGADRRTMSWPARRLRPGRRPTRRSAAPQCTANPGPNRLANGIQIFPGSVPDLSRQHPGRRRSACRATASTRTT